MSTSKMSLRGQGLFLRSRPSHQAGNPPRPIEALESRLLLTTYYVDSVGGKDANAGTSTTSAWQTINKVNTTTFQPGDNILFKAGDSWNDDLVVSSSGSSGHPITYGMYGTGAKPEILGNGSSEFKDAVEILGKQYVTIDSLYITSAGSCGVNVKTNSFGLVHSIHLTNLEITGITSTSEGAIYVTTFNQAGISSPDSYDDVLIQGNYIHGVDGAGIYMPLVINNSAAAKATNVVIRDNVINGTGSTGIMIEYCQNAVIEGNTIYHAGEYHSTTYPFVGLFPTYCSGGIIQDNEVAYTAAGGDSMALDIDVYCTGTWYVQYNYTHSNAGGFFLLTGNTLQNAGDQVIIRYNISQDEQGGSRVVTANKATFYNNVFYDSTNPINQNLSNGGHAAALYYNNIFDAPGQGTYSSTSTFSHNAFYNYAGTIPNDPYKLTVNPQFIDAGGGGDGMNTADAYQLQTTSPLRSAGQIVSSNGGLDFFGDIVPSAKAPDIGAYQHPATVVAQHIFYNDSYFNGYNTAASAADDGAIAPDKQALLPGETATFANYTSYSRGIDGLMVDIAGLASSVLSAADFTFTVGNDSTPSTWATAPAPTSVTVRSGAGANGSDRVTLIWPDNAIQEEWLQVTVLADSNTGLASPDVFYFGNAIGESGNSTANAWVNSTDEIGARLNPQTPANPAAITNVYDYNRDGLVNSTDQIIARTNPTTPLTALQLIQVPATVGIASVSTLIGAPVMSNTRGTAAVPRPVSVVPARVVPARVGVSELPISPAPAPLQLTWLLDGPDSDGFYFADQMGNGLT